MDRNILIAIGMLLTATVVAMMKGSISGNDAKDVLILVGGGIMGVANAVRTPTAHTAKPAGPPPLSPAAVALVVVGGLMLVSCASHVR